jgi:hypothetical protein
MSELGRFYLAHTGWAALTSVLVAFCFLAPGLVPALALARRLRLRADETLVAAFAVTTALAGVCAAVCYYLGLPLWAAAAVTLAAAVGLGWYFRDGLAARPRVAPSVGLWLALAAWALSTLEGTWFGTGTDAFYHVAAVRTMIDRGLPVVTDPFYGTASRALDVATGAWHSMLAMVGLVTRVPADALWFGMSPLVTAMFALGFYVVARRISRSTWAAAVATCVWAVAGLLLDTRLIVMPQTGALTFVFAMMLGLLSLADDATPAAFWLAVAGGVAAILTHVGVAELTVIVLGVACVTTLLLARLELKDTDTHWARAATPMLLAAATVGAIVAMPLAQRLWLVAHSWVVSAQPSYLRVYGVAVPVLGVMPQLAWAPGRAEQWFGWPLVAAAVVVTLAGDVLLAAMAVEAWRSRDLRRWLATAFAGLAFLLLRLPLFSWVLSSVAAYMTVRLLLLVAFCPYLALAWALAQPRAGRWRSLLRPLAIGLCVFAVVSAVPGVAATFIDRSATLRRAAGAGVGTMWERDVRYEWGADALAKVRAEVGTRYPVVASDELTGYELSALEPIAIVAVPGPHAPFFMETVGREGEYRRRDMTLFMRSATSEQVRRRIAARYHVAYVVVSSDTPHHLAALLSLQRDTGLLQPVVVTPRLAMFRVKG